MMGTLLQRLDVKIRHLLPISLMILLFLFDAIPKRLPYFTEISPILPLAGIYYWAIFRPDLLGAKSVFLLGVAYDLAMGTPLGVSSAIFLGLHGLGQSQRRFFYRKPFLMIWLGFSLMAFVAMLLQWAFVSLIYGRALPTQAAAFSYLMTISAYPVVSWFFARLQLVLLKNA